MDLQKLSSLLKTNGVVGAGGAGFPSYAKLNTKADTVILNCAECEPLLQLHQQLLTAHTIEILSALQEIAKILQAENVIICVKKEYKDTVEAVKHNLESFQPMELKELKSIYPTGDEVVLIYEATNRVVRPGGLPIEQGVIVFNVETVYNIHKAMTMEKPVTDKLVTINGEVNSPITVRVPIGTSVKELVEMAGGSKIKDPAYLMGGPMMGTLGTASQAVTKTTNAVLILPKTHQLIRNRQTNSEISIRRAASSCCQCQSCTDMCPRNALGHPVKPHAFMLALANNDVRDSQLFLDVMFCCGCGICEEYACPQSLMPRTLITEYKNKMRQAGVKPPSDAQSSGVIPQRPYRSVPEKRLESRVGLSQYKTKALLDDNLREVKTVTVMLSQHIGAPAVGTVKRGDMVKKDEIIANSAENALSVAIHAPIDGKVVLVTKKLVVIEKN